MMPPDVQLTSEAFWSSALLWGAVDLALVSLLVWRIPLSRFRELKWAIAITGAVFWGILSAAVLWGTWDIYYRHFYPEFTRWLPPLVAVLCGAIG